MNQLAQVLCGAALKTPVRVVVHSPLIGYRSTGYGCSRHGESQLIRDVLLHIKKVPALFVITDGDIKGSEIQKLKKYFLTSSRPKQGNDIKEDVQQRISVECKEDGSYPALHNSRFDVDSRRSNDLATLPVFLVPTTTPYQRLLRLLNPTRVPCLQLLYHHRANRRVLYPLNETDRLAHPEDGINWRGDFDVSVARLMSEALAWIDLSRDNGELYSATAEDPSGTMLFGTLAALLRLTHYKRKPFSPTELQQIHGILRKLSVSVHWKSSLEPFIHMLTLRLHLRQWNAPVLRSQNTQNTRIPLYGDPGALQKDLQRTLSLHRGQYRQIDYYRTISQCQLALFDVKVVPLENIRHGLSVVKEVGPFSCLNAADESLAPLKKIIRTYRERFPEPQVDVTVPGDPKLHNTTHLLFYKVMGTQAPAEIRLSTSASAETVNRHTVKFASRLHRMAAAKLWMQHLFHPSSRPRTAHRGVGPARLALRHALTAYRLETSIGLALPCLSNDRLTFPASRLLMCLLGCMTSMVRLQDRLAKETYHLVAPKQGPDVKSFVSRKRCIGRARGGRPMLDRGKKRYLWQHPMWKPPWAPKRPSRLEEWSWKF